MKRTVITRRTADDSGAILVIAIIVITVVSVVTGLVLTRGDGSLRATIALRNVAGTSYAADGAAQVALNALRTGYWDGSAEKLDPNWAFTNVVGDGCFGRNDNASILSPDGDLLLSEFYTAPKSSGDGDTSAYVTCVPEDATGAQGTVRHVTTENSPGHAVITLGSGGENGLHAKTNNNSLKVRGGIWSNSNIVAERPIEVEDASVRARTGCTGTITVEAGQTKNCSSSGISDPNYPADISSIPEHRSVPAGCGSDHYIAFEPGYYDDAAALENLTTSCNKIFWFKPGAYYFDFHNNSADPLFETGITNGATDNEWYVSRGKLIAGTPIDGSGNVLSAPPANPTIPGSCQNPIDSANAQGVQFVFGGDSRIHIAGNPADPQVELCATYRASVPPIVLYGAKTGDNPSLTEIENGSALTTAGAPTIAAPTGSDGTFTPLTADVLQDTGNGSTVWQRTAGGVDGNEVRRITMGGFAPPTTIQKGAVLKQARLIVRHKSALNNAGTASTIKIMPSAPNSTALATFNLGRPGGLTTETIDLKASQTAVFNALAKGIHDNGYTGSDIEYTATVGRTQSAELDAVRLELEYYVPQMRGPAAIPNNCLTVVGGGCAVLASDHNFKGHLYLQGTTYAALQKVDIGLGNLTAQVFRWGIIARSLYVESTGAFGHPGAVIELPDNSPGFGVDGTIVQMTVYVCQGSDTCDDSGRVALKVRAQVWDEDGNPSTIEDRQVTVLSWSHQR